MKKSLVAFVLLLGMAGMAKAEGYWGEVWNKLYSDPKFTLLETVSPLYYYDFLEGKNLGGAVTKFYALGADGIFTVDAGWLGSVETAQDKGAALLGVSIHTDKLIRVLAPQINEMTRAYLPDSVQKFVDAFSFGPAFSFNSELERLSAGITASVELSF